MRKTTIVILSLSLCACKYSWAFGEDAGPSPIKQFAGTVCTQELAQALYTPAAEKEILVTRGNQFFYPGKPGQSYYVHGFRSQASCDAARKMVEGKPHPTGMNAKETRY